MHCTETGEMVFVALEETERLNIGNKEQSGSQGLATGS